MKDKPISFAGGEVRSTSTSNAVYGTEVWNRDPLPKPKPRPSFKYELTVSMPKEDAANESPSTFKAIATSIPQLMDLKAQSEALGYEFIKLERLDPA